MKDKKAFTVAEVLTTLTIVAVLSTMAIWLVNKDGIERREYLGRYNMILPQLEEIAALTAQNSNYFEDWWAESNSLIGLECDSENPSVCLREAFMSSTSNLRECDDDDECFPNRDEVNNRLQTIYADLGGVNINDMQILQGVDAVYGLLYNDASCTTQLRSVNGRNIDACGVIFIDVNGRRRPNIMADQQIAGDRFLVALTRNGVEQTELMTAAAGCPENSYYDAQRRTCLEEHQCSVSQDAVNRAQALIAANANNPDTVSVSFPDGEEFADTCVTARCTMGLRPKPNGTCPGSCPAGEEFAGGLFLSDGGDIDDLLWENKLCCKPIRTQDELSDIRNATADTYCLMNDITLTGNWTPINNFTGKLFGNGFKINNLRISQSNLSSSTRIGFFRNLGANAVVKDIEFVNPQITVTTLDGNTTSYIGTLVGVGTATSNISNIVINNGRINTSGMQQNRVIGGVSGQLGNLNNILTKTTNITDTNTTRQRTYQIGGITGVGGNINRAISNGTITVTPNHTQTTLRVGGISAIGISSSKQSISDVINTSTLKVNPTQNFDTMGMVGGIIGLFHSNTSASLTRAINLGSITTSNISANEVGSIAGDVNGITTITNTTNMGGATNRPLFGNWRPTTNPTSILYLTGHALRFENASNDTATSNAQKANWTVFDSSIAKANLPPQLTRDCNNINAAGAPPANCFNVLNTENSFIPRGDSNISMWAYEMPPYTAGTITKDALVLRWQCKPYRSETQGGLDCCRPSYATWEPNLPICPSN